MDRTELERDKLEQEIMRRLLQRPCDADILKSALSHKTDAELENLLKRMKDAGRYNGNTYQTHNR